MKGCRLGSKGRATSQSAAPRVRPRADSSGINGVAGPAAQAARRRRGPLAAHTGMEPASPLHFPFARRNVVWARPASTRRRSAAASRAAALALVCAAALARAQTFDAGVEIAHDSNVTRGQLPEDVLHDSYVDAHAA